MAGLVPAIHGFIQAGMTILRPITVITGASAGIGVELARIFARNGYELALVARRADRLLQLADELAASRRGAPNRNSSSIMPASDSSASPPNSTATSSWP
jgi:NAD(P)-dependent dehydrogenase (short-subunit alcohol dehydrogenase family)